MGNSNFQSPFANQPAPTPAGEAATPNVAAPFNPMGSPNASANPALPFGDPNDEQFSFDLTNVDPLAGRIPLGTYIWRLADVTDEVSNSSGNRMFVFHLAIVANADGTETPHAEKIQKKYCALTAKALGILANTVAAFGLGQAGQPLNFSKKDAINRLCYGEMIKGTYNGQETTNLGNIWIFDENNPGKKWNPTSAV